MAASSPPSEAVVRRTTTGVKVFGLFGYSAFVIARRTILKLYVRGEQMDSQRQQRISEAAQRFTDAAVAAYRATSDRTVVAQRLTAR
jgi:hypothetical protein